MGAYFTAAVAGLTAGGACTLLGVCAVFAYRLVAVVNFAGAAIGAAGVFAFPMLVERGAPIAVAAVIDVIVGAVVGVGAVKTRWLADASASTKAAVAVTLLVGLAAVGLRITGGQHPHDFLELLGDSAFRLAGVEVTNACLATLALAFLFTIASRVFLKHSYVPLQLWALAERPVAAELIGVPVQAPSLWVMGVSGAATALALTLIASQARPFPDAEPAGGAGHCFDRGISQFLGDAGGRHRHRRRRGTDKRDPASWRISCGCAFRRHSRCVVVVAQRGPLG